MRCPTCSSPLPDGAMFCGQCGRAITAADVAAFQKTQEAGSSTVDTARPEIPAWRLHEPPPAAVPAGTPWWRSESAAETSGDDPRASDAQASDPRASDPVAPAEGPEAVPPLDEPVAPVAEQEPVAEQVAPDRDPAAGGHDSGGEREVTEAAASTPPPLRAPEAPSTHGPRPTSAPLWTASLTPITEDGPADHDDAIDAQASDSQPGPDESEAGHKDPAPLTVPDAPQPGDTNVVRPLVAPTAARVAGSLRCTVCGADLAEDDIFCGECGTVVQSVAQSFTGPITPILTGIVPEAPEPSLPPDERDDPSYDGRGGSEQAPVASESTQVPVAPTPVHAPAPTPAQTTGQTPEAEAEVAGPPAKKRRLFGRRTEQESPQLWSSSPAGTERPAEMPVPPMPPTRDAPAPMEERAPQAPVGLDQVPAAPAAPTAEEPTEAPLAATPVDAPPQIADPTPVPLPPAPESLRPAIPWAVGATEDDVEKTRIVRRQPLGEPYVLQFSTGESFTVQGTGLVGRAPTPQPGEAIDLLVRIVDPGKSVSKTHLEFGQENGELWVSDRWSGNGSVVREPGREARRCEPGKRVRVSRGARVDIGEQFFIVA